MRLPRTLALALVLLPSLAHAGISRELAVSPRQSVPAPGSQWAPSIATRGDRAFAAWVDNRSLGVTESAPGSTLVGSRVDGQGHLVDPAGIFLAGDPRDYSVSLGNVTVLAAPHGYTLFFVRNDQELMALRITAEGQPIDSAPVLVARGYQSTLTLLQVATNGDTYLLSSGLSSSQGSLLLLDADLQTLNSYAWSDLGVSFSVGAIASDGSDYLALGVAPTSPVGFELIAAHITVAGVVASHGIHTGFSAGGTPPLVWTGHDYLVANPSSTGFTAARLDRDGNKSGPPIAVSTPPITSLALASMGGGSAALVLQNRVLQSTSDIQVDLFSVLIEGNDASPPQPLAASSNRFEINPNLTALGDGYVVVYDSVSADGYGGVDALPLDAGARRRDGGNPQEARSEQTRALPTQRDFATIRGTASSLAAWVDQDGNGHAQVMIRNLADLTSQPRPLAPSTNDQGAPSLATDGSTVLVTWTETQPAAYSVLRAIRVTPGGQPLDPQPITLGPRLFSRGPDPYQRLDSPAAIAWNGALYLVAFTGTDSRLRLVRITSGGVPIDSVGAPVAPPLLSAAVQTKPTLVATGGTTFLVWQEGSAPLNCVVLCGPVTPAAILGLRIAPDGTPLESRPFPISPGFGYELDPDAAWNGDRLMVVWQRDDKLYGTLVTADGAVDITARAVRIDSGLTLADASVGIDVGPNKGVFLVAWQRPGITVISPFSRVVAAHVRPTGVEEPFPLSSDAADQHGPHLWTTAASQTAVGFNRLDEWVPRLRYVVLDVAPPPGRPRL
jgi:hypothetical protein